MSAHSRERGFATFLVLWTVALLALMVSSLEVAAWRQAAAGREALARVRAHWAARAGVEAAISQIGFNTVEPDYGSAFTILYDLEDVSRGTLEAATFTVEHTFEQEVFDGPADAHAKININTLDSDSLMTFEYMTEDVADAIQDWFDQDDDTRPLGAEIGYYLNRRYPYEPRNDFFRTITELELVAGVDPIAVRGEDWNLNGLLDPNEDDGDLSWPPDDANGELDGGWSEFLTAASRDAGLAASGLPRINLIEADEGEIMQRLEVDSDQAITIRGYAQSLDADMATLISTQLGQLVSQIPEGEPTPSLTPRNLTDDELAILLDEATLSAVEAAGFLPGKLNINTCSAETLEHLPAIDAALADSIILERDSRAEGFVSLVDLLDVPSMNRTRLASIYPFLTTRSNVYVVTSRGRDERTGLVVEMVATVDRSTLPIIIRGLRVQ